MPRHYISMAITNKLSSPLGYPWGLGAYVCESLFLADMLRKVDLLSALLPVVKNRTLMSNTMLPSSTENMKLTGPAFSTTE